MVFVRKAGIIVYFEQLKLTLNTGVNKQRLQASNTRPGHRGVAGNGVRCNRGSNVQSSFLSDCTGCPSKEND
jgi:hypothetical protein